MSDAASHGGRNNPWLDLVRSLAILLVLFRHGQRHLSDASGAAPNWLETIALNGWIGVDLFFVLSGYLIARHLLRAGLNTPNFAWSRYLAMRVLRIVPAYYAVLLLVVAGSFPLFEVASGDIGLRVLYHLVFLQDYLPSDINVVFWSLGAEEKFYLLAPFLIVALLRCRSTLMLGGGIAALFVLPSAIRIVQFAVLEGPVSYPAFWAGFRSPFHMTLEGFVIGVGIAIGQARGLFVASSRKGTILLAGALATLALWMASDVFMARIDWFDAALQPPLIALLAGAIVLGGVLLADTPLPGKALTHAIATLAYTLYLVHFPLIPLAAGLSAPGGTGAFWAVYLALSTLAALALNRAVEAPFLVWKDRIAGRSRTSAVRGGVAAGA